MKKMFFSLIAFAAAYCVSAQADVVSSFTLEDCQQMAFNNNRTLQNARLDLEMAEEDSRVAFTKFFPSVSAGATGFIGAKDLMRSTMDLTSFGQTYGPMLMQMGFGEMLMNMPPTNDVSMVKKGVMANVVAMQPLYAGGQIRTGNRLAALQQEVRRLQIAMNEKEVALSVADYYWQMMALRGNLATLDAADEQLSAIHTMTENYLKAGLINRNDLLTVELKQQETASARLQVENGLELLRLVLAQLCGADVATFNIDYSALDANGQNVQTPDNYFVSPEEAVYNREELALAEQNVAAQGLQIEMERGKLLPSVAVGAAALYQGIDMGDMSVKNGGSMYNMSKANLVGLATVSIPVTDWWGGKHAIAKAKLAQRHAENDRADALERLQIDIISSWNNLTEAYAQIEIARKSVTASTENLRLCREQYGAGTSLISDLLDAVTLYTKANNDLASSVANYEKRVSEYVRKTR